MAATARAVLQLGGRKGDLAFDLQRGHMQLVDRSLQAQLLVLVADIAREDDVSALPHTQAQSPWWSDAKKAQVRQPGWAAGTAE